MDIIYHPIFLEHDTGMHPESRKRFDCFPKLDASDFPSGEGFLTLVHTSEYIQKVKEACAAGMPLDHDTMTSKKSYAAACMAVGATIAASERGGLALCRPPGHHAHADRASGFCLFNNVAIAAQKLVNEGKRVLIFDFDGHLGDGTEKFFYATDAVMYFSLHQYPAFPGWGDESQIGEGKGKGYSVNVPLPLKAGDDIFRLAVERFLPVCEQFKPDAIAVSAGFDAHQYDLLLDLRLSLQSFHWMGKLLKERFSVPLFATLEGGYNVEMLPKCVASFVAGIEGKPYLFSEEETDSAIMVIDEYEARADRLERKLCKFWKVGSMANGN